MNNKKPEQKPIGKVTGYALDGRLWQFIADQQKPNWGGKIWITAYSTGGGAREEIKFKAYFKDVKPFADGYMRLMLADRALLAFDKAYASHLDHHIVWDLQTPSGDYKFEVFGYAKYGKDVILSATRNFCDFSACNQRETFNFIVDTSLIETREEVHGARTVVRAGIKSQAVTEFHNRLKAFREK